MTTALIIYVALTSFLNLFLFVALEVEPKWDWFFKFLFAVLVIFGFVILGQHFRLI